MKNTIAPQHYNFYFLKKKVDSALMQLINDSSLGPWPTIKLKKKTQTNGYSQNFKKMNK